LGVWRGGEGILLWRVENVGGKIEKPFTFFERVLF